MLLAKRTPSYDRRDLPVALLATARPIDVAVQSASISDFDSNIVLSNHVFGECAGTISTLIAFWKGFLARVEALVPILPHFGRLNGEVGDLKRERHG